MISGILILCTRASLCSEVIAVTEDNYCGDLQLFWKVCVNPEPQICQPSKRLIEFHYTVTVSNVTCHV